jgi:hypothetical protein
LTELTYHKVAEQFEGYNVTSVLTDHLHYMLDVVEVMKLRREVSGDVVDIRCIKVPESNNQFKIELYVS